MPGRSSKLARALPDVIDDSLPRVTAVVSRFEADVHVYRRWIGSGRKSVAAVVGRSTIANRDSPSGSTTAGSCLPTDFIEAAARVDQLDREVHGTSEPACALLELHELNSGLIPLLCRTIHTSTYA